MCIDIADADDIKSEEEYQSLKRKQSLNELVWFTFEKKHDLYLFKN